MKISAEKFRKQNNISGDGFGKMTADEFKKLNEKKKEEKPVSGERVYKKKGHVELVNDLLLRELEAYLQANYNEVKREHQFDTIRQFRFDFALPNNRIAIEIEGGLWVMSGHRTGKGYQEDMEKYNLAASQGWFVYRFSYDDLKKENYKIYL